MAEAKKKTVAKKKAPAKKSTPKVEVPEAPAPAMTIEIKVVTQIEGEKPVEVNYKRNVQDAYIAGGKRDLVEQKVTERVWQVANTIENTRSSLKKARYAKPSKRGFF